MINDSGLTEEDVFLKRSAVMPPEERSLKKYLCGFESCQTRECFDTWKHVQQHYKNYHKVTVKKKDPWNESVPRIKEVKVGESEDNSEESQASQTKERLKRKRSARTDGSSKVHKNLENESSSSLTIEFTILLSNITLLAKITKDFTALQVKNEVMNESFKQDPATLASVSAKLKEFNDRKLSYEHSIEIGKKSCNELNQMQKTLLDGIPELNAKELTRAVEFAKYYLSSLQLFEMQKSPEYIALLALHELLNDNLN